ncbi:hypothetical protein D3C85_1902370 [compost metagenome]
MGNVQLCQQAVDGVHADADGRQLVVVGDHAPASPLLDLGQSRRTTDDELGFVRVRRVMLKRELKQVE